MELSIYVELKLFVYEVGVGFFLIFLDMFSVKILEFLVDVFKIVLGDNDFFLMIVCVCDVG